MGFAGQSARDRSRHLRGRRRLGAALARHAGQGGDGPAGVLPGRPASRPARCCSIAARSANGTPSASSPSCSSSSATTRTGSASITCRSTKKGFFEPEWNDFDRLTPATKMLHNTKRRTQPWKTGLPVDFVPADKLGKIPLLGALNRLRARVFGDYAFLGRYSRHPDPNQEAFFFGLLGECLASRQRDGRPLAGGDGSGPRASRRARARAAQQRADELPDHRRAAAVSANEILDFERLEAIEASWFRSRGRTRS